MNKNQEFRQLIEQFGQNINTRVLTMNPALTGIFQAIKIQADLVVNQSKALPPSKLRTPIIDLATMFDTAVGYQRKDLPTLPQKDREAKLIQANTAAITLLVQAENLIRQKATS